ncbi:hypothetical protein [Skermania piniformis]|uniref:YbaB/EbfC DNA-binding family protein n=1 Tax=Skermania pinensis TaxID=39122 RepID=A0ABX8S684_9ACTN|nr:hypothetical protein [Skermania piniformis]QXQ13358.1 hypothetical protein KV203_16055 [Skermania piniformis]
MIEPNEPLPSVTTATRRNRSGTVAVRANDQGLPVEIRVERAELRYGAGPLAAQILALTEAAAAAAGQRRRDLLAAAGVQLSVLDRLGLPTRSAPAGRTTSPSWRYRA